MLGLSRFVSGLFAVAFLMFAWATYLNVWSPLEPIQAAAERAACGVKDCKKQHGATKIDRLPYGQAFEYTWESGTIVVNCHPASYVYGRPECKAEW
jgi:hypothetical protein